MLDGRKVVGIICECNPFHEGHKRLINAAKKEGDIIIAIMSGNFVQRGEPAVHDKYSRSKKLLKSGVSMVIELPVEFTLSSAKYFALSSVKILDKLGFVDKLIFGSMINDVEKLSAFADVNIESENNVVVKSMLKSGSSYSKSLSTVYGKKLSPNDILAVEYISAIKKLKSHLKPISIKRVNDIPTASELRKNITKKITNDNFSSILNYKLLLCKNNLLDISDTYLMTNDFYNSLMKLPNIITSFGRIAKSLKTKNRTLANIKRVLLNVVLGINKNDVPNIKSYPKYIRILAVKKSFLPYLREIRIPSLISFSPSSYKAYIKNFPKSKLIKANKNGEFMLSPSINNNIFANNLYYSFSSKNTSEASIKSLII
ncbi:MAG: nucleotidyltransferase family protein [Lachnospiraceae bacterium]|nr:nucleotidyltransferase family protein [Lachnospiraceae bacterium]